MEDHEEEILSGEAAAEEPVGQDAPAEEGLSADLLVEETIDEEFVDEELTDSVSEDEELVAEELTTAASEEEKAAAEASVSEEAAADELIAEEPEAWESAAGDSASEDQAETATGDFTGGDPAAGELVADELEAGEPVAEEYVSGEPVSDEPMADDPSPAPVRDTAGLARDIEAVLFISSEPVSLEVLAEVTGAEGEELAHAVEAVREKHSDPESGITFAEVAGGYTFRTGDLAREAVERFCRRPVDYSLSPAAMETLAIIAYLQPITRPEVARIRGVGADTVVANLLDKGLVEEAGRNQQTGAVKYRTTAAFEKLFGLVDLSGLPSLEGFEATPQDVEELREKLHLAAEKRQ